jgi:hypothetical protein
MRWIEGGMNQRARGRTTFALAALCLGTGAAGLFATFVESRVPVVPFEPIDYSVLRVQETEAGPGQGAPGSTLDGLNPEAELVATVTEEATAPPVAPTNSARVSAAGSVGGASGLAVVPAVPVTPPDDAGVVLDAEPPETPATVAAAPPAAPSANNSAPPRASVIRAETGTTLPYAAGPSNKAKDDKDNVSGPSVTNQRVVTPTATPTKAAPAKANKKD